LDFFPTDLGDISDECGERFHQEVHGMKKKVYPGKSNLNIPALKWIFQIHTSLNQVERDFENVKIKYIFYVYST
jgi:hypothetical protein